jgi:hypothetical protein
MLRDELGYGEEISLLGDGGKLLYDIDFDDLLSRCVQDVGLTEGRTLTVVDEEFDRVNVEFIISEGEEFIIPKDLGTIPRKPVEEKTEMNGVEKRADNGVENNVGKKRVREDDDDVVFRKKARVAVEGNRDVIFIDEDDDTVMIE